MFLPFLVINPGLAASDRIINFEPIICLGLFRAHRLSVGLRIFAKKNINNNNLLGQNSPIFAVEEYGFFRWQKWDLRAIWGLEICGREFSELFPKLC